LPAIEIVVPKTGARLWQKIVVERLRTGGHEIAVVHGPGLPLPVAMRMAAKLERRLFRREEPGLMSLAGIAAAPATGPVELSLDLTGVARDGAAPTLRPHSTAPSPIPPPWRQRRPDASPTSRPSSTARSSPAPRR
jgi:hypothetical protein